MNIYRKHITHQSNRTAGSYWKSIVILLLVVIFFPVNSFAQVINNSGAAISVQGAVVGVKDIENNAGSLGNNGVLNISGNFLNANPATTNGNGYYNLTGNWTNNGTFIAGTSTVSFLTGANQTITHGSSGETFYILTINNPGRTITHISNAGGTLTILNNLNITAGTFSLHSTTSTLTVGGRATIGGALIYNGVTPQTASVGDVLSGVGTIDMSGGSLPHYLYLAGSTNAIGTFITSGSGSSTVNYNGTDQTVFAANNYRNLIISNSGIKTLVGNSIVNINLNITGGTFDLGTTATSLSVTGNTNIDGGLNFNNTSTKTVTLTGNLSGTGSINMGGNSLSHTLYLAGSTNSIGSYTSGTGSTVNYTKNAPQSLFSSDNYRNLIISGTGLKTMAADISASGILTMSGGNIDAGTSTLKVTNSAILAINRSTGNVIGKLQRAIAVQGTEYLYPLGTSTVYNPLKLAFHNLTPGPLTAQFKPADIGNAGLPLDDNGNEIWDRFTTGYWTLTSVGPMNTTSFSANLNFTGFSGVDLSSSVIKRTNGGNLEVDGSHGAVSGSEITRALLVNGISTTTTDLAIGKGRAKIDVQPSPIDICELSNAFFAVSARGRGTLTYQWQVNTGSGFTSISNGGVYTGATTNHLTLTGAPYSMNGYTYRCIITDGQGNINITNTVLLTVNKIPIATASPTAQNECPGVAFTNIVLGTTNGVTGTTFAWSRTNPAGITTTLPLTGTASGDQITGTFTNTLDAPITVTFTIIPTGPATTFCIGNPITVNVTVNPTPRVFTLPAATVQCDSIATSIRLTSPSTFTSGVVTFKYSVTETGSVSGYTSPTTGIANNAFITDRLKNNTDVYQIVTYRVVPVSPVGCVDGPSVNATVTVNPTPRVVPVNVKPEICPAGGLPTQSQVTLTSPTVMSSGYGEMRFDYSIMLSAGIIGNSTPEVNKLTGYTIVNGYQNTTDDIKSVYYTITPKVDNAICVPGRRVTAEVKVHAKPLQTLVISKPLTCDGGAGLAELTATISKNANPYKIIWDGPVGYHKEDLLKIVDLSSGKYLVKVTDNLGCFRKDSISVVAVTARAYIQASVIPPGNYNISCIGSTDGTILAAATGGITPPYTYQVLKNDVTVIGSGVFTGNLNLLDPTTFRYFTGLGAGSYTVVITDVNLCVNTNRITLKVPPPITVGFTKSIYSGNYNISCKGYSDGSATVSTISGGRGGYSYRWYTINGNIPGVINTNKITNIPAGRYFLETKDILGCTKIDSVDILEPAGMQLSSSVLSKSADGNFNISCNAGNDGSIDMTIVGGSGNYLFSWTSPNGFTASTEDISGLKAGVYTCTVRDLNGCILTPSPTFTLTEPAALSIGNINSVSNDGAFNINCFGGTGSVNLSVSGGSVGNYSYTWTTTNGSGIVQGQEDQSALTAGTYHVVVTDLNNCVAEKDITLTQPPDFALQLHATNITCQAPAFNNGSINLSVSGGVGPYTYTWSNGATTQDVAGLTEGSYHVTVTYNNTCSKSDAASVSLPPVLTYTKTLSDYNSYNISCNGMSNGSVLIEPTSGVAPFVYTWTGPGGFTATTKYISNLKAGQYNLHIVDSNYCTVDEVINLTEPGLLGMTFNLSSSVTGEHNINCAGDSTGTIGVEPLNQVNAVQYLWSDGITDKTRSNLPAGSYGIIITDANNCQASSNVTLTQPDSIKLIFSITQPFCPDKPDGEIRLTATGGVKGTDYRYKWSDNSTTATISNLLRGLYKVVVTDLNLCQVKDSVNIEPQNESCLIIPNAISPNDDLINDVWNIGMIELYPNMEITIYNRWSQILWKSEKGYARPWDGKSKGKALPIDSYHYIIDLHNGTKPIIGTITIVR